MKRHKNALSRKSWQRNCGIDRETQSRRGFRERRLEVKRELTKERAEVNNALYERLDTKEGEQDLCRLARQRDRRGMNIQHVRVI